MNLIVGVMAALMGFAPQTVHWVALGEEKEIAFAELPAECRDAYDPEIRKWRGAQSTRYFHLDIDGNGSPELFLYTGETGSGGEGWCVYERSGARMVLVGRLFGYPGKVQWRGEHGLLNSCRCGWQTMLYDLYKLKAGKLVRIASYRSDLSDHPEKDPTQNISYIVRPRAE